MHYTATLLAAFLLITPLSACATVSPYGEAAAPTPEAQAYAEALLEKPPETLTDEERAFLLLYAQQAEARNTQARAQSEQGVFAASTGLTLRAVISDCPEAVRVAAWAEVAETLKTFETTTGFSVPAEVLVAAGVKPT